MNSPPIALLFPGQGSQYPGMGRDLCEHYPVARAVFEEADAVLGFPLSRLCFEGPAEELQLTANTQPAILTCSVAAYRVLAQHHAEFAYVAGHSLGEYSALVAAGSLTFADAVRTVRHRGQYMQEAVPVGTGAMAALVGLSRERVQELCHAAADGEVVASANINTPEQIVIAGHIGAVRRAMEQALQAGAKRAVELAVSAPFHCALMVPAQQRLLPELAAIPFRDLSISLVNNVRAEEVRRAAQARQGLIDQIPFPVLWEPGMRKLLALGVRRFVEVGPGRVLSGLLRQIDRSAAASNVEDIPSLEKTLSALTPSVS
jgi:[acyl-carrier-protein] S-malonyltransferase